MTEEPLFEAEGYAIKVLSKDILGPIIFYISNPQFGNMGEQIKESVAQRTKRKFTFCEISVRDWDKSLTPWKTEEIINDRNFTGEGKQLLQSLSDNVLPTMKEQFGDKKFYITGYSLAGMFALWSLYENPVFDGCACCSGSVWYPGFEEYVKAHSLVKQSRVYLSLGKKEKNTKHPFMKNVEKNMCMVRDMLALDENTKALCMNLQEGGHFHNNLERMVEGIIWLLAESE